MKKPHTMLGGLIRERRKDLGLSQVQLADRIGLTQRYISRIEGGAIELPQRQTLMKLGGALGISLAEFYQAAGVLARLSAGDEPPPPPQPADPEFRAAVARIEARPDLRDRLERVRTRCQAAEYRAFVDGVARVWLASLQMALDQVELFGQVPNCGLRDRRGSVSADTADPASP